MKHVRILLSLSVVVILFSALVLVAYLITEPIITEKKNAAANLAKAEVLPSLADYNDEVVSSLLDYQDDLGTTGIVDLYVVEGYGVVYQVAFQGYQSKIEYMLGIDESGTITGYKTLSQGDTPLLGAEIANPVYWEQFAGMSLDTAAAGDFDTITGATVTSTGWKNSIAKVVDFHNSIFLGYEYTDVTNDVDAPETITSVVIVSSGSSNVDVIYTAEFESAYSNGANAYTVVISLADGRIKSLTINEATDSAGIGALIGESVFSEQFNNLSQEDVVNENFDVQAGASFPVTFTAFKASLAEVVLFHRVEYEGYVAPVDPEPVVTDGQKLYGYVLELYPEAFIINNVSSSYTLDGDIEFVFEAYDDQNNLLGHAFLVNAVGASYDGVTYVRFVVGIDEARTFVGFRMFDDNETPGKADPYYLEAYEDQFVGLDIEVLDYDIDAVAGSTVTHNALMSAVENVARFYVVDIQNDEWARPAPLPATTGVLQQAFPSAVSFTSIYLDLPYSEPIANVYEALDGVGTVIGYVYVGTFNGYGINNYFVWGVDVTNETELFTVLVSNEDWAGAPNYLGTEEFKTAAFLDYYEGINIADILTTPANLDAYAGVSTTTSGVVSAVETIVHFHLDNVDGGGS